jgi:hypothetical protein
MKCPTDPYNDPDNDYQRGLQAGLSTNTYARGNFAWNAGPDRSCVNPGTKDEPCVNGFFVHGTDLLRNNDQVWGSGVGGVNKSFPLSAITDGLSSTVVVDEIRAGIDLLDPRGAWALGQVGSSIIAAHGSFEEDGGPNPCSASGDVFVGCDALTKRVMGRLHQECMECLAANPAIERNVRTGSRSLHPRGVNVLILDGSVRFVPNAIDADIWHAIHTRDGSETTGNF